MKQIQKAKTKERQWNTEKFRKKLAELVKQEEASQRIYYRQHRRSEFVHVDSEDDQQSHLPNDCAPGSSKDQDDSTHHQSTPESYSREKDNNELLIQSFQRAR